MGVANPSIIDVNFPKMEEANVFDSLAKEAAATMAASISTLS